MMRQRFALPGRTTATHLGPYWGGAESMLNIRLRSGVAGEAARVVHAATGMTDGTLVSLCGQVFDPAMVEESRGMPCTGCMVVAVRLSSEPATHDGPIGLPAGESHRRGDRSPRSSGDHR